jgi:hypothetical protein
VGLGASDQEAAELVDSHPVLLEHKLKRLQSRLPLIMTRAHCTLQQAVRGVSAYPHLLSNSPSKLPKTALRQLIYL